jgi:RES domain-containing protein
MSPLALPPADLNGFPRWTLPPDRILFRIHRRDRGAWYFDTGPFGRFNLSGAWGTCYLALVAEGAFLETLGRQGRLIDPVEVSRRVLSTLHAPRAMKLANAGHARARAFGVTGGIGAVEESDRHTTRAWSEAFHAAGFDGVRYRVSHDPSQRAIGVALFGPAGEVDWPTVPPEPINPGVVQLMRRRYGLVVLPTP